MKQIPLTKGKVAIVDDDMYEYLMQWKWHACSANGKWYARRIASTGQSIRMHHVVLKGPADLERDHINGNGLDNRRENLRLCTHAENMRNQKKKKNTVSRYKGVGPANNGKSWRARIEIGYRSILLGNFDTEEDAAIAYNHAALEHFGDFASFNNIPGWKKRTPERRSYSRLRGTNTSGFVGVSWNKALKKWHAYAKAGGRRMHLGFFTTAEEAARAYDRKARELFGDFARTNFDN